MNITSAIIVNYIYSLTPPLYIDDWKVFSRSRHELKCVLRQAEVKYFKEEIQSNSNNTGAIWKTIRRALPKNSSSNQRLQYTKDTSLLADEFNNYSYLSGRELPLIRRNLQRHMAWPHPLRHHVKSPLMMICFPLNLSRQLKFRQMPNNKAPGYDKVPVIKDCLPSILSIITSLSNCSFETGVFPWVWRKAEVVPHLKDGDHEVANNNSKISLLPVLSKVVERVALEQYKNYLNQKKRLKWR